MRIVVHSYNYNPTQSTSLGRPNASILHRSVLVYPLHPMRSNGPCSMGPEYPRIFFTWCSSTSSHGFFVYECIVLDAVATKLKFWSFVSTELCNCLMHTSRSLDFSEVRPVYIVLLLHLDSARVAISILFVVRGKWC